MDEAIPGNWILIATGVLVEASMALWTWPIEAEAIGVRSKDEKRDRHSEPSSVLITFYRCSADRSGMHEGEYTCICQSGM